MSTVVSDLVISQDGLIAGPTDADAGFHNMTGTPAVLAEREAGRGPSELGGTLRDGTVLKRATVDARTALREAAFAAAEAAARARSVAEVLDETLAVLAAAEVDPSPPRSRADGSPRTDRLSAREREVLALVAAWHQQGDRGGVVRLPQHGQDARHVAAARVGGRQPRPTGGDRDRARSAP